MESDTAYEALARAVARGDRLVFDASGEGSVLDASFVRQVLLPLADGAVARASSGWRSTVAVAPGPEGTWLSSEHEDLTDPTTVTVRVFASAALACAHADSVLRAAVSAGALSPQAYAVETRWRDHAVADAVAGSPGPPFAF